MLRAGLLAALFVASCSSQPPQEWRAVASCSCASTDGGVATWGFNFGFCENEGAARASCDRGPALGADAGCLGPPGCRCLVTYGGRCD